jgi:hypothetical protein
MYFFIVIILANIRQEFSTHKNNYDLGQITLPSNSIEVMSAGLGDKVLSLIIFRASPVKQELVKSRVTDF